MGKLILGVGLALILLGAGSAPAKARVAGFHAGFHIGGGHGRIFRSAHGRHRFGANDQGYDSGAFGYGGGVPAPVVYDAPPADRYIGGPYDPYGGAARDPLAGYFRDERGYAFNPNPQICFWQRRSEGFVRLCR